MAGETPPKALHDYFTLQRGTTYMSRLLEKPGPVLLGLASIQRNGGFRSGSLRTYGGDSPKKLLVQPGELYVSLKDVTQSADLLGAVARLPIGYSPGRLTQDTVKLVPKHDDISIDYIYCLLRTPQYRNYCRAHATGTTNLGLPRDDFLAFAVPELTAIRQRIINIILALDDKIELNRRMNETLEAMARGLFKDWFVDFGPTRAKAESRDPYLAPEIWDLFPDALDDEDKPAGWAEIPLKKLGTVITGKTPSTKKPEFFGDDMPFLKIPDMRGKIYVLRTSTELSEDGVSSQKKKTLPPGSVSVSCIATPGLVIFNHQDTQTNQQINSLIPSDLRQSHFVFWSCRQLASAVMLGGSGGSVFHNMNKTSFENLRLVYPGEEIARMYSKTVSPMHNRMLSSEYQSDSLAQARDLLLPKLMSGKIRVGDADKIVKELT